MPEKRDQSFSRLNRLSKASEFKRVFSRGKRIATKHFVVYLLPNGMPDSRLGIQVRARVANATRRNYIKRIAREVFRKTRQQFRNSCDLILIAEKPAVDLDYHEFESSFRLALGRYFR